MSLLQSMILLPFFVTLALGQVPSFPKTPAVTGRSEILVRRLYQQVLARPSVGIPYGENLKIYSPYLSKALLHKMDVATDCGHDFYRLHPDDPNLPEKPPFAWLELGTFTGGDDESSFHAFHIEGTNPARDGSVQVNLKLTWGTPPEKPWFTNVTLVIRRENGRDVVDDIIYRKAGAGDVDWRLTQVLSSGCSGRHWVGYHNTK